jgi:hypothetical protein
MLRRDLLRAGVATAAAASVPSLLQSSWSRPAAAATPPRNLLVVFNYGGWDTTVALDAKPAGGGIDVADGEITRIGEISIRAHESRASVTEFFRAYGAVTSVVNGIQVRSIAHDECLKRILTGTPQADNADVAATAAFELGRELPVPYLVLGPIAMTGGYGSIAGRTGSINQLGSILVPGSEYPPPRSTSAYGDLVPTASEEERVGAYLRASAERQRAARGRGASNAKQLDDFVRSLDREGLLRRFVKDSGGFGSFAYTPDLRVQSEIAVRAIERGLSNSVMLGGGFDWDTHNDNAGQSPLHQALFAGLLDLGRKLEAAKLLERTTVLVLSEMGRTPKLNVTRGKDHWPVTSALVFGAGVRGNRVVGATDDALGARSIDLTTGLPARDGKQLQTANLAAAVLRIVGVDPSRHLPSVEPLDAIVA